jgi:cobalt-zinc-cadmium efflux system outer membrane protein
MTKLTRTAWIAALLGSTTLGCAQVPKTGQDNVSTNEAKSTFLNPFGGSPTTNVGSKPVTNVSPRAILSGSESATPLTSVTPLTASRSADTTANNSSAKSEVKNAAASDLPKIPEIKLASATETTPLPDGPMTLEYFEELADRVNPTLRRDRAGIESAIGSAVQAGLWSNPQFNANNPWVYNGRSSTMNAGFQQEIPVMGKKRYDEAAANESTRQAELTYKQDRLAMLAQIRQQFYTVLIDQRRVEVLTELVDVVYKSYDAYQKKQKAGDVATPDVLLLKIDYDTNRAKLENNKRLLDGDRKQLEALVGVPGCVKGRLIGEVTGPYPLFDEQKMLEFVTNYHTQIKAGQSQVQQNRLLLKRAEIDPWPNPTIGPAYQFGLTPGSDQFWLNLSFTIPVLNQNQGAIRSARANVAMAIESIDANRLNLVNQVANLYSQYLAAKETVDRFESDIMKAAKEADRLVKSGFVVGVTDFNTYLTAQRAVVQANSDYLDALQQLWTNATQLSGVLQMEKFTTGEKK